MKSHRFAILLCAAHFAVLPRGLPAVETVKVESVLHVFKATAIPEIKFGQALMKPPLSGAAMVFSQPSTVLFDREKLVLDGANYTWNGGSKVPAQFFVTGLPTIIVGYNQAATIRAAIPTQYLERTATGDLQVREVDAKTTDIPHYQLTLKIRPSTERIDSHEMVVSCQTDIATVQGREKIPGVELEVGRPILAHFDESIEYSSRIDEWSGLLINTKASGDYVLLLLLKISAGDATAVESSTNHAKPIIPSN